MFQTINLSSFHDAFRYAGRDNAFSYVGRIALFRHLEEMEAETGSPMELDVVALCCDYTEYKSCLDAAMHLGMEEDDEFEYTEESAREWLECSAVEVIQYSGGVLIRN